MTTLRKVTTVDTTNLQPGELIHMNFVFYNVTSVYEFTSMINVVCENNITLSVFTTVYK